MISTQVHLVLGTIKGHPKKVLREQQIRMHTAAMSTRAVARELNLSPIRRLTPADHVYGVVWTIGLLMSTL